MKSISISRVKIFILLAFVFLVFPDARAFEVEGLIEPHRVIKIGGSGTPGILEVVNVDRGGIVKKGQILAMLQSGVEKAAMEIARARAEEDATIKIKVEKASSEIARARAEIEAVIKARRADQDLAIRKEKRNEELYKKDLVPFAEMDESETKRVMAEAQLEEAVLNKRLAELDHKRAEAQVETAVVNKRLAELEYERAAEVVKRLIIQSPIDGVVVERFLSPGEYVEQEPILKLAQIDPLNVEVILPVAKYLSIKMGMRAEVIPEAPLRGSYTAEVKIIDKVIDAASGTFGVRLQLPNPNYRLPAGLKCKVIFPKQ
jgi:multidrug efflux pump subunit AcrA (membrane-fusion protein)